MNPVRLFRWFRAVLFVNFCAAVSASANAPAHLVRDINPKPNPLASSEPSLLTRAGERVFFTATDGQPGTQLWLTDGTDGGTSLVKRIANESTYLGSPTAFGSDLLFFASDGEHGVELWRSDGSEAGTAMVQDITPGPASSFSDTVDPQTGQISVAAGFAWFAVGGDPHQSNLWRSDGTGDGTAKVADITVRSKVVEAFGAAYFLAMRQVVSGIELWRSDGTQAGTVSVGSVNGAPDFSLPILHANGAICFIITNPSNLMYELWRSDGTGVGTALVKQLGSGRPAEMVALDGDLYFTLGSSLWRSDGSADGTREVVSFPASAAPSVLTVWGERVYFVAESSLWAVDPTGVSLVSRAGIEGSLTALDGWLYFAAGAAGADPATELWKSDGSDAGTVRVRDIIPGDSGSNPYWLVTLGHNLLFSARDDHGSGRELWISDGSEDGTQMLRDIWRSTLGSRPVILNALANLLLFSADDGTTGKELWVSDGTEDGTRLVLDIAPGPADSMRDVASSTVLGDRLYFPAHDGQTWGLWSSDGTTAVTHRVADLPTATGVSILGNAVGRVFFQQKLASGGIAVSSSDGVGSQIIDIGNWTQLNTIGGWAATPGRAFFSTTGSSSTNQLWVSDGTALGSTKLLDTAATITNLVPLGDGVLFAASRRLWHSDGTSAGTQLLSTASGAPVVVNAWKAIALPGFGLLFGNGPSNPVLWRSDGSAAGTTIVWDTHGFGGWIAQRDMLAYLTSPNSTQMWRTDGSTAGTQLVADLAPQNGTFGNSGEAFDNFVVFAATEPGTGTEVWRTDGSAAGTFVLTDINPGVAGSYPDGFKRAGNYVFFAAENEAIGRELWAVSLDDVRSLPPTCTPTDPGAITPTPTVTPTRTPTPLRSISPTRTQSPARSATPTQTPSPTRTQLLPQTRTPSRTPTPTQTPTVKNCTGDCNHDGEVTIDELVRAVAIALETLPTTECTAADANQDRAVTVDEVILAVNNGLLSCPI